LRVLFIGRPFFGERFATFVAGVETIETAAPQATDIWLASLGYERDATSDVWKRPDFLVHFEHDEIEERIASAIASASDLSILSLELRRHQTDWASRFHLSSSRANLLRPFNECLAGDVLEVGAACGALTRYLGENSRSVLALESNARHAAIARSRTRDLPNVAVINDAFNSFEPTRQFDVVILIDVLDHAHQFIAGADSVVRILKRARSLLKPTGTVIIAIENGLGLKHLAGVSEGQHRRPVQGVKTRCNDIEPSALGRRALAEMLYKTGFGTIEFLAPFPDHTFPVSIVTQKGFEHPDFDAAALAWQNTHRDLHVPTTFSLELAWPQIIENELGLDLANSFLISASATAIETKATALAWHYTTERAPHYCKETTFDARSDGIVAHYSWLAPAVSKAGPTPVTQQRSTHSRYVRGQPLARRLVDILARDGWRIDDVANYLLEFIDILDTLYRVSAGSDLPRQQDFVLPGRFVDVTPQNIIVSSDGKASVIDQEWDAPDGVRLDFLLVRSLLHPLLTISRFGRPADHDQITRGQFMTDVLAAAGYPQTATSLERLIQMEKDIQLEVTRNPAAKTADWGKDVSLLIARSAAEHATEMQRFSELNARSAAESAAEIQGLSEFVARCAVEIQTRSDLLRDRDARISDLVRPSDARVNELEAQLKNLRERNDNLSAELKSCQETVRAVYNSTSWRASAPIRFAKAIAVSPTQALRSAFARKDGRSLPSKEAAHPQQEAVSAPTVHPDEDQFIAVPFGFKAVVPAPPPTIAVMLHCYYLDELPLLLDRVSQIPFPYSLFVTTTDEEKKALIQSQLSEWSRGPTEVRIVENRGRDIAPRLIDLRAIYADFEYVLHIHTKKSMHNGALSGWLSQMLCDVLGSEEVVRSVFAIFSESPDTGVIAPRYHEPIRPFVSWGPNFDRCQDIAHRMGLTIEPDQQIDFPAGSVFWARTQALKPLLDLNLERRDFEPEQGQADGTLAHACERMVFLAAEQAGFTGCFIGQPSVPGGVGRPFYVRRFEEIDQVVRLATRSLLTPEESIVGLKARFRKRCASQLSTFLASDSRIVLKTSDTPQVSIILVLHNSAELTYEHIRSLETALTLPAEVIIVDNGSTDETRAMLGRIDGARVLLNTENMHFLHAVNQGAEASSGDAILLLNNDTSIPPDAIATAYELLQSDRTIGAVGGKLILLDGTLQEAGSIVWSDGTCAGYGRGRPPSDPMFEFRRDVDYCSGAFLMLPRKLFAQLGGLDPDYAPAYYEETDLCMRVRAAGYRVIFEPSIQISHVEWGSGSFSAAAKLVQRNHSVFVKRHADTLARCHYPPHSSQLKARSCTSAPRLLMIDDRVPYPALGTGYPRAATIIREVQRAGWFVTLYPLLFPELDVRETRRHFAPETEFAAGRGVDGLANFLRERADYYDAVLVSRPSNMKTFQMARNAVPDFGHAIHTIYDAEALFAEREKLRRRLQGRPFTPEGYRAALGDEMELLERADTVLAVSEREKELIAQCTTAPVHIVGHGITPTPTSALFSARRDILFVGSLVGNSETAPNVDSIVWFAREVMPLIDAKIGPNYRLRVAGQIDSNEIWALAGRRIELLGRVANLGPLYSSCRIFVAPTRFAAGIPHKVQEANANGLPAVATSLIASQLGRTDGVDIMAADDPEAFARACCRLYTDPQLWAEVRSAGLQRVSHEASAETFRSAIRQVLDSIPISDDVLRRRLEFEAKAKIKHCV
jgi:GT2 family glycosyltransferase/SAM-dependent methyltransferase